MMDQQPSDFPPLRYDYPLYGVHLRVPVFKTGPLISISDPPHGRKTCRNQPQYGTHTASLGIGYVVNHSLVALYDTHSSGLVLRDIHNVDKQDDGAARRVFHHQVLEAATITEGGSGPKIRDSFHGIFVYLFIFGVSLRLQYCNNCSCADAGTMFDAWLNRHMTVRNRVLSVIRARFFLHCWWMHIKELSLKFPDLYSPARSFISPASFHIFNRLCDTMLILVLTYARWYPDQPFCPWLLGTEFVEHFFGLARMILPNFGYAEFLKLVRHVMVRQQILLTGDFQEGREKHSAAGYILDFDSSPLTAEDRRLATVKLTDLDLNSIVELGYTEAKKICIEILKISIPSLERGLSLVALGMPQHSTKRKAPSDEDSDSDSSDEVDFSDEEDISDSHPSDDSAVASATYHTARYSALCEDYDHAVEEANSLRSVAPANPIDMPTPLAPKDHEPDKSQAPSTHSIKSAILDGNGKVSIELMLKERLHLQSGSTAHSEKLIRIDPKFALSRVLDEDNTQKIDQKEAAHRLRVAQDLNPSIQLKRPKKDRESRWKNIVSNIKGLISSECAS